MQTVRVFNPPRKRTLTREAIERRQTQAVRFTRDVVGDPDRADEIESMTPEQYAEERGFLLTTNPYARKEVNKMPKQQELIDAVNRLSDEVREFKSRSNPGAAAQPSATQPGPTAPAVDTGAAFSKRKLRRISQGLDDAQDALHSGESDEAQEILDDMQDLLDDVVSE